MCYIVGAVIAAVGAIGGAVQQADMQRRQVHYQQRLIEATETNAALAAESDYVAAAERIDQTRQAAAQESFEASRELDRAQATVTAGAQDAGLSAGAVGDLRTTIAMQAAESAAIRERNTSWEEAQIMRSLVNIQTQQQSRLNQAMPNPVPGVDYASLIGGLGQAAALGARQ